MTRAYILKFPDAEERREMNRVLGEYLPAIKREFELGKVEFCAFEDMHSERIQKSLQFVLRLTLTSYMNVTLNEICSDQP
jgi:hypothetical protein